MQDQKPPRFKTFYLYATIVWGLLFVVFIGMSIINNRFYAGTSLNKFTDGLLETILIMGIIGIPLIMVLSLPIRFAEKILDWLEKRMNKKNKRN